jgi:hypothetical protein
MSTINKALAILEGIIKDQSKTGLKVDGLRLLHTSTEFIARTYNVRSAFLARLSDYSGDADPSYLDAILLSNLARQATTGPNMPYKTNKNGLIEFDEEGNPVAKEHTPVAVSEERRLAVKSLVSIAKGIWTKLKESENADGLKRPDNISDEMWAQMKQQSSVADPGELTKDGYYIARLLAWIHGDKGP